MWCSSQPILLTAWWIIGDVISHNYNQDTIWKFNHTGAYSSPGWRVHHPIRRLHISLRTSYSQQQKKRDSTKPGPTEKGKGSKYTHDGLSDVAVEHTLSLLVLRRVHSSVTLPPFPLDCLLPAKQPSHITAHLPVPRSSHLAEYGIIASKLNQIFHYASDIWKRWWWFGELWSVRYRHSCGHNIKLIVFSPSQVRLWVRGYPVLTKDINFGPRTTHPWEHPHCHQPTGHQTIFWEEQLSIQKLQKFTKLASTTVYECINAHKCTSNCSGGHQLETCREC